MQPVAVCNKLFDSCLIYLVNINILIIKGMKLTVRCRPDVFSLLFSLADHKKKVIVSALFVAIFRDTNATLCVEYQTAINAQTTETISMFFSDYSIPKDQDKYVQIKEILMLLYSHCFSFLPRVAPNVNSMATNKDRTGIWVFFHGFCHAFLEEN